MHRTFQLCVLCVDIRNSSSNLQIPVDPTATYQAATSLGRSHRSIVLLRVTIDPPVLAHLAVTIVQFEKESVSRQ